MYVSLEEAMLGQRQVLQLLELELALFWLLKICPKLGNVHATLQ